MGAPMEHPLVSECVKGNSDALAFLRDIAGVLHTWDDLFDRDKVVSEEELFTTFLRALVTIPANPFYLQHQSQLMPILVMAIVNWRAANQIERSATRTTNDQIIAFIIRSTYVDLLTTSAVILGGIEWASTKAVEIRRWAHSEGYDGYLKNLEIERQIREGN